MDIIDIIKKKDLKQELTYDELKYAIDNYVNGNIDDDNMGKLLFSILNNNMTLDETFNLTKVMLESGDVIDLSTVNGIVVDKHSTGGVGDKTTLVVEPLAASLGIKVAKMSGRALGYTGGTIDKIESIKGFKTNLTTEEFIKEVNDIGMALTSQTENLAPADKKIYALRDIIGAVESIPLIASSIMSKKIALGAEKIVLDVKVGKGAFMKDIKTARELSETMIYIGKKFNREVITVLTNMEYPLGNSIGNSVEVQEAIDTLDGKGDERFTNLCVSLAAYMVSAGKNIDYEDAFDMVVNQINNKEGLNKLKELIKYQGGDINSLEYAKYKYEIKSDKEGYLVDMDTLALAKYVNSLGAGRVHKEDKINHKVGIILNKKINDKVEIDDTLGYVLSDDKIDTNDLKDYFIIKKDNIDEINIILDVIK